MASVSQCRPPMTRGRLSIVAAAVTIPLGHRGVAGQGQTVTAPGQNPPVASFKSSIDMVRIAAVVRDSKGRFVQDLTARDFEVVDGGTTSAMSRMHARLSATS